MLWLAACRPEPVQRHAPEAPVTSVSSGPIAPSAQIAAPEGGSIGGVVVVPATASDPPTLLLTVLAPDLPAGVALAGPLPRGEHALVDLWDGASAWSDGFGDAAPAGDVDGDGHADLWCGGELHHGPLVGSAHTGGEGAAAGPPSGATAGGFDADGDGALDVILGTCLYHGPFAGSFGSEPDVVAFGGSCGEADAVRILPDALGPGRDAVQVELEQRSVVYDLAGAEVGGLWTGDALWPTSWWDAGDLDADGVGDAVVEDGSAGIVVGGPLTDGSPFAGPALIEVDGGYAVSPVGDVDGDGVSELLCQTFDGDWVLAFSPFASPVDLADGVRLDGGPHLGRVRGDLDGDRLADVIGVDGGVSVWFGADLR